MVDGACKISSINQSINQEAKNLRNIFDQTLPMTNQVGALCKSLHFEIRRIYQIWNHLSLDVTVILIVSFDGGDALVSSFLLDSLSYKKYNDMLLNLGSLGSAA